jgi:hypothetical protein
VNGTQKRDNQMSNRRGASAMDLLKEEEERRFEQDNDEVANSLAERVGLLREITVDIHSSIQESNRDLEQMGFGFESARTLFQGTMGRLERMTSSGSSTQTCKLACLIVGSCTVLYVIYSLSAGSRG